MPWQVQLQRKDGTIRSDIMGGSGSTPKVGDVIDYPIGDETVKAVVSQFEFHPHRSAAIIINCHLRLQSDTLLA